MLEVDEEKDRKFSIRQRERRKKLREKIIRGREKIMRERENRRQVKEKVNDGRES